MLDYAHITRGRHPGLRFIAAALASVAIACGADEGTVMDAGAEVSDTPAYTRQLEVGPSDEVDVPASGNVQLSVKLTDMDGEPIPDAAINFALSGDVRDNSLQALSVQTDDHGRVDNTVRAGTARAEFVVRISAASAEPATVRITVVPEGLGTLQVNAAYAGERMAKSRTLSIYANQDCVALDDARAMGMAVRPRYVSDLDEGADTLSVFLPAGERYVVQGEALGEDDMVLAVACHDAISLTSDPDMPVEVELEWTDVPLLVQSDFEVHATLDTAEPAGYLADAVREAMSARIADSLVAEGLTEGEAPAAYLLTALLRTMDAGELSTAVNTMDEPMAAGEPTAASEPMADSEPTAADIMGLEPDLQAALDAADVGPDRLVEVLAQELRSGLAATDLHFWLRIGSKPIAADTEEAAAEVSVYPLEIAGQLVDETRMPPEFALDSGPVQLEMAVVDGAAGEVSFEALRLPMPLSSLAYLSLRQLAGVRDAAGANRWLAPLGCEVLQDWWVEVQPVGVSCDASCVQMACERAFSSLVTVAGDRLDPEAEELTGAVASPEGESADGAAADGTDAAELISPADRLLMMEPAAIFEGVFALIDADGDLVPDSLMSTSFGGTWESPDTGVLVLSGEAVGEAGEFVMQPE